MDHRTDQQANASGIVARSRHGRSASEKRAVDDDLSWLPDRGEGVIVGGTRIFACDCEGPPFYRLSHVR